MFCFRVRTLAAVVMAMTDRHHENPRLKSRPQSAGTDTDRHTSCRISCSSNAVRCFAAWNLRAESADKAQICRQNRASHHSGDFLRSRPKEIRRKKQAGYEMDRLCPRARLLLGVVLAVVNR